MYSRPNLRFLLGWRRWACSPSKIRCLRLRMSQRSCSNDLSNRIYSISDPHALVISKNYRWRKVDRYQNGISATTLTFTSGAWATFGVKACRRVDTFSIMTGKRKRSCKESMIKPFEIVTAWRMKWRTIWRPPSSWPTSVTQQRGDRNGRSSSRKG